MADITKCTNDECPLRNGCYRFTATNDDIQQWYAKFDFFEVELNEYGCEYLLPLPTNIAVRH
jgi:hypothetical protein